MRISSGIAAAFISIMISGSSEACQRERVITPYWSAPPPDLAEGEVALEVEFLGDPSTSPPTMSSSLLAFRVKRVVAGTSLLKADAELLVLFQASCRTLMTQAIPGRSNLLIGKLMTHGDQAALTGTRYRECSASETPDRPGFRTWTCPF